MNRSPQVSVRRAAVLALAAFLALPALAAARSHGSDAFLGISSRGLDGREARRLDLDSRDGAVIEKVYRGTGAYEAGLERGDVIVEFDGHHIYDDDDLTHRILDREPGDKVSIVVLRDDKRMTLDATLGSRDDDWDDDHGSWSSFFDGVFSSSRRSGPMLGVHVMEMDRQLAEYFSAEDGGILVTKVSRRSAAERAGLQAGDVVVEVAGDRIYESGDISDALRDRWGETVSVTVLRRGSTVTKDVTLEED